MEHIYDFESFINEAAENFAVGDLVRYSKPGSGIAALYGVIVKAYSIVVDIAIVGKSDHEDMQPTETYMKMQFVPGWKGAGMSAEEMEKKTGGIQKEMKKRYLTRWENS
jgi:hypothetical protein